MHAFPDGRAGTIRIDARPRGNDEIEITFADDGVGMSDDVQRRAFDPFFTTRRNQGGTGLGLHIIYNLVTQQLGGRLHARIQAGPRHHVSHHHAARRAARTTSDAHTALRTTQWPTRTISSN